MGQVLVVKNIQHFPPYHLQENLLPFLFGLDWNQGYCFRNGTKLFCQVNLIPNWMISLKEFLNPFIFIDYCRLLW
jgi:hypothetical protein